jgi:lysyl-tRNA synthetase class 2
MIVATIADARRRSLDEVSLNFAGFAHVMAPSPEEPLRHRLLRLLLTRFHGRFQLERLAHFNQQFLPHWRPRYIVYGSRTHLPLAGLRVLQAESYIRAPRGPLLSSRLRLPRPAERPVLPARPEATR